MLGDVEAVYLFEDYRLVGALTLPHALTIQKEGRPYASIRYSSIALEDPSGLAIFDVPEGLRDQADAVVADADADAWAPLTWAPVAPGVYHAVGFSHHSMVVEFPTFVVVVEAPYTEAQGLTLGRRVETELGKPIRYVVPSHPHYDHTGGVRALAAEGADVLTARGHEAEIRKLVEAPHSNPPDALARRATAGHEVGQVEVFAGTATIEEGAQSLELYEVTTIPHVNPKVLAYVPSSGALFQSDLFFGGPGPDATALHAAVTDLGLDVETIVGGHGGVLPFDTLTQAAL
jgi:glyoxylase-like metal-dependent hydrolase (beta-lactamase superfamily II)